jgi:hypothetical protein
MKLGKTRVRLAIGAAVALGIAAAVAPSAFASTTSPFATATATGVTSGSSLRVVVQCEAVSKLPAAATEVRCDAGPAHGPTVRLPGQTSASAGTGVGAVAPFTVCVYATTYPILGTVVSSKQCSASIFGQGAAIAL